MNEFNYKDAQAAVYRMFDEYGLANEGSSGFSVSDDNETGIRTYTCVDGAEASRSVALTASGPFRNVHGAPEYEFRLEFSGEREDCSAGLITVYSVPGADGSLSGEAKGLFELTGRLFTEVINAPGKEALESATMAALKFVGRVPAE